MSAIEDKIRRRLAPFVAEGKIGAPVFPPTPAPSADALTVSVHLKSSASPLDGVEAALHNAIRDLGAQAQLVINPAQ